MTNTNYNHRKQRRLGLIGNYIVQKTLRASLPGRITNGQMFVYFEGQWISEEELNKVFPPIVIPTFNFDANNVDTTRLWIHQ